MPPERVFEIAGRLAAAGAQEIGFGDTTGMANPRAGARVLRAGVRVARRRRRAHRALPQHARAGAGQRAGRAGGRGGLVRVELRRAGRLPGARRGRPATSPPRTSSRCCTRWASRRASTSRRCSSAARAVRDVLGRPLGSHTLVAGPVDWHHGGAQMAAEGPRCRAGRGARLAGPAGGRDVDRAGARRRRRRGARRHPRREPARARRRGPGSVFVARNVPNGAATPRLAPRRARRRPEPRRDRHVRRGFSRAWRRRRCRSSAATVRRTSPAASRLARRRGWRSSCSSPTPRSPNGRSTLAPRRPITTSRVPWSHPRPVRPAGARPGRRAAPARQGAAGRAEALGAARRNASRGSSGTRAAARPE